MTAVAQTAALTGRNLARLQRNPASLVGAVATPAVFFAGFFVVMRKILEAQGVDYEQFLPPAIVVQAMIFVAMSSAYFVADDREKGMADRLRSLPLAAGVPIAARVGADLARASISLVVVLALGFAVGFRFAAGPGPALGFVLVALAFAAALALAFGFLALVARRPEAAVQGLSLPYIFLFMLSVAFVPAQSFPGWLEPIVREQPVSRVIDALRVLSAGGPTASDLVVATAWIAGIGLVSGLGCAWASTRRR